MLLNDKVPFRMQWPQYTDLQVNGMFEVVLSLLLMNLVSCWQSGFNFHGILFTWKQSF